MKQISMKLFAAALIAVVGMGMTSCSDDEPNVQPSPLVGLWLPSTNTSTSMLVWSFESDGNIVIYDVTPNVVETEEGEYEVDGYLVNGEAARYTYSVGKVGNNSTLRINYVSTDGTSLGYTDGPFSIQGPVMTNTAYWYDNPDYENGVQPMTRMWTSTEQRLITEK